MGFVGEKPMGEMLIQGFLMQEKVAAELPVVEIIVKADIRFNVYGSFLVLIRYSFSC